MVLEKGRSFPQGTAYEYKERPKHRPVSLQTPSLALPHEHEIPAPPTVSCPDGELTG